MVQDWFFDVLIGTSMLKGVIWGDRNGTDGVYHNAIYIYIYLGMV